jgi:hypothetical protein
MFADFFIVDALRSGKSSSSEGAPSLSRLHLLSSFPSEKRMSPYKSWIDCKLRIGQFENGDFFLRIGQFENGDAFLRIGQLENENRASSWRDRSKDRLEGFVWKKHTVSAFDLFMEIAVARIADLAITRAPVRPSGHFKKPTTTEVKIFNFGEQ